MIASTIAIRWILNCIHALNFSIKLNSDTETETITVLLPKLSFKTAHGNQKSSAVAKQSPPACRTSDGDRIGMERKCNVVAS